jgi:5'-3' exonuclease
MGIPSYFSQVVRRHSQIIKQLRAEKTQIDNLYLDSNSIIYDALRILKEQDSSDFEERLIKEVCDKIEFYIGKIRPTQRVIIAFDGVAPMAKLKQQRERRYKSWYQACLKDLTIRGLCLRHPTTPDVTGMSHTTDNRGMTGYFSANPVWNTSAITPGTSFMEKLSKAIEAFSPKLPNKKMVLIPLTSNGVGEGEHKIFEYIRANAEYHKNTTTVIYGLDADLIMLSLNHIHITKQLYLHRETPEFIKNIDSSLDNEIDYLFCIQTLNVAIVMECFDNAAPITNTVVVGGKQSNPCALAPLTYVFMCFLLGNDFLPHFPALNIRTNGLDKLMNAYKLIKSPMFFTNASSTNASSTNVSGRIVFNWKNIRAWIDVLAKQEHENIKEEYVARSKYRFHPSNKDDTLEEKYDKIILQYPMREREVEEYINPNEPGWEKRYYRTLFSVDIDDARRKEICMNYLEGLEWTMKYYTSGCPDWNWSYKYNYPPLLTDLIRFVPYFETILINPTNAPTYAVSPLVQLSYVLPKNSMYLLPDVLHRALLKTHPEWYGADYPLVFAFTKYIWESHVTFPEIDMAELKNVVESVFTYNKSVKI